jgi:hypothetical protein
MFRGRRHIPQYSRCRLQKASSPLFFPGGTPRCFRWFPHRNSQGWVPFKAASELSPEPSHGRAFRAHVNSCEYGYGSRVGIQGGNSYPYPYSYPASTRGSNSHGLPVLLPNSNNPGSRLFSANPWDSLPENQCYVGKKNMVQGMIYEVFGDW